MSHLNKDQIREVFLASGFTVKPGETDLKQYVFDAADNLLAASRNVPVAEMATNPHTGVSFVTGSTQQWFVEAIPEVTEKHIHVQLGVHFEEVGESLAALVLKGDAEAFRQAAVVLLKQISEALKAGTTEIDAVETDWDELGDGLGDTRVTSTGSLYIIGADVDGLVKEIDDSNFSKYVDGKALFNDQGKIAKGPNFYRPDIKKHLKGCPPALRSYK